jgi:uncharacterized protein
VATACVYVCLLALLYIKKSHLKIFSALQSLGKMTLTNYLLISAFCITLQYGIGFGQLGIIPMHQVWLLALICLIIEVAFCKFWQQQFRYGPMEWLWRQLTYQKRIPLRKNRPE